MVNVQKELRDFEENLDIKLPTQKVVCPRCNGGGTHDCFDGGISNEDMYDQDFIDDYMRGNYTIQCSVCEGRNVVDEVDPESVDPKLLMEWREWLKSAYDSEAIYRQEIAMGA